MEVREFRRTQLPINPWETDADTVRFCRFCEWNVDQSIEALVNNWDYRFTNNIDGIIDEFKFEEL